jgi:hypothetical protein
LMYLPCHPLPRCQHGGVEGSCIQALLAAASKNLRCCCLMRDRDTIAGAATQARTDSAPGSLCGMRRAVSRAIPRQCHEALISTMNHLCH